MKNMHKDSFQPSPRGCSSELHTDANRATWMKCVHGSTTTLEYSKLQAQEPDTCSMTRGSFGFVLNVGLQRLPVGLPNLLLLVGATNLSGRAAATLPHSASLDVQDQPVIWLQGNPTYEEAILWQWAMYKAEDWAHMSDEDLHEERKPHSKRLRGDSPNSESTAAVDSSYHQLQQENAELRQEIRELTSKLTAFLTQQEQLSQQIRNSCIQQSCLAAPSDKPNPRLLSN
eukprot:5553160-Amphidinium_carterae.1